MVRPRTWKKEHAEFDSSAPTSGRLSTVHSASVGGLPIDSPVNFRVIGDREGTRHESPEFLFRTASGAKGGEPGLPSWWAEHYFGAPVEDLDADADGDGWGVWAEYVAETSPVDPGSRPVFSVVLSGEKLHLLLIDPPRATLRPGERLRAGRRMATAGRRNRDDGRRPGGVQCELFSRGREDIFPDCD